MSIFSTCLFHAAQVGAGPLNGPSFTQQNAGGVIDIPATAYVTIDATGPDVLLTAQLTGGLCGACLRVWLLACLDAAVQGRLRHCMQRLSCSLWERKQCIDVHLFGCNWA